MRAIYTIVICAFLVACGDKKEGDNTKYLPASNGNLNSISVVVDNALWEGSVGESVRAIFAAPINGLNVDEPMFTLSAAADVNNRLGSSSPSTLKLTVVPPSLTITPVLNILIP